MGGTIENVWRDRDALLEIRRVIRTDGKLRLSVQLYDDDKFHCHIYSPFSIQLILRHAGFNVTSIRYSGLIPQIFHSWVAFAIGIVLYPIFRQGSLRRLNRFADYLDRKLSGSNWWFHRLVGMTAYIEAKKSEMVPNMIDEQKVYYE